MARLSVSRGNHSRIASPVLTCIQLFRKPYWDKQTSSGCPYAQQLHHQAATRARTMATNYWDGSESSSGTTATLLLLTCNMLYPASQRAGLDESAERFQALNDAGFDVRQTRAIVGMTELARNEACSAVIEELAALRSAIEASQGRMEAKLEASQAKLEASQVCCPPCARQ